MTVVLDSYPDVEAVLVELFMGLVPPGNVVAVTDTDLQSDLPVIRVRRIGGSSSRFTDSPRVDVEAFSAAMSDAKEIAGRAQQRLISGPSTTTVGIIDRATTEIGPREVPWPDQNVRRQSATYRISLRRLL